MDYYFPGVSKQIMRVRIKAVIWTLAISAFIFTPCGYMLHYLQVTERHKAKIAKLEERNEYYRAHWTPIRDYKEAPIRQRKK